MGTQELEGWLRLALTPGVGNATVRALLSTFGLPDQVFAQSPAMLATVATPAQVEQLLQVPADCRALVDTTAAWLQADPHSRRVLTLGDAMYPQALLDIEDPPLILYAVASAAFWAGQRWPAKCLAVVGSRNPTAQGAANAKSFARDLAQRGVCVVSGLAMGIDGAAHEGALSVSGQVPVTVAVVGTGLDRVYPARHRDLAHRIASEGVLLSEYPLGTPPLAHNFPKRNRILCGLSAGTLVVEAAMQSGSLITARLCVEQGKEVFAIPGSIHSPQSKGCHALIRQGAKLVESAQDVLEEIPRWTEGGYASVSASVVGTGADVTPSASQQDECPVVEALGYDPVTFDVLQARTGWATAALQVRLMELELASKLSRLPGGLFQRMAQS